MTARSRRLPVIAAILTMAASIKVVQGVGGAMAQMPLPAPAVPAAMPGGEVLAATLERVTADLVLDLRQREEALAERAARVEARIAELSALQEQLAAQIADLDAAEQRLQATMALADQAAESDLQRLTAVFEVMRPEQAAQVVSEMAPEFAAGLIGRLQPPTAAAIMAGLEPRVAYGLAAILAGRNANVPRR